MIPTPYEGYIVSVHRMGMENRPVDPGSIQGSHRPISFMRINTEHARTIFCVKLSINNHIVGLVHKNNTEYKVPLREEARGVAQERNEKHPA